VVKFTFRSNFRGKVFLYPSNMNLAVARVSLDVLRKDQFLVPAGNRTLHCPARSRITIPTFFKYNYIALLIGKLMTLITNLTLLYALLIGRIQTRFRILRRMSTYILLYVDPIATVSTTPHPRTYAQVVRTDRHPFSPSVFHLALSRKTMS
jgi:hypothetical protein